MSDSSELKKHKIDPSKEKLVASIGDEQILAIPIEAIVRSNNEVRTFNTNPSISFRHDVKQ